MASWRKMLMMGTTWLIFMAVFSILAIVDGVFWSQWDKVILMINIPAPVQSYVGQSFYVQALSYVFLLVLAIVMTYKIVQATADESDYGTDISYDSWGFNR